MLVAKAAYDCGNIARFRSRSTKLPQSRVLTKFELEGRSKLPKTPFFGSYRSSHHQHHGRVPSVLFFTPTASGVTTGVAAPTNSLTTLEELFETHTLPELSMAAAAGLPRPPPANPVDGVNATPSWKTR
jgi:hypothetical protein